MLTAALVLRVVIAGVFVVSGLAKLLDRDGTRQAVDGFGVPARLVAPVALLLAPAELVTAVLLLPDASAVLGLTAALALLAAFTATVVVALATGRRPECHCFGRIGGADVSVRTVARNVLLMALAAAALVGEVAADDADRTLSGVLAAVAIGLTGAAIVVGAEGVAGRAARRRRDEADERAFDEGMARMADEQGPAPDFRLPTLAGGELSLGDLLHAGRPVLLVWLNPGCGPCKAVRPAAQRWADAYRDRLTVAVVASGGAEPNAEAYADSPDLPVLLDDLDLGRTYGVRGTPGAVLITPDGQRAGGVAQGERLVRRLLAAALSGEVPDLQAEVEPSGAPAESIELDSVVAPRRTVTAHAVDEQTILVDEASGASHSLDQIGGIVWSVLDGASPLDEIAADLAEAFGAPPEVVAGDVLQLARALGRAGLLEGIAEEPVSDEVDVEHDEAPVG